MTDDEVLAEIQARHRRYGWTEALTGEWGDLQSRVRASFRERLDSGDPALVREAFASLFRTALMQGLVSYDLGALATPEDHAALGCDLAANVHLWFASTPGIQQGPSGDALLAELEYVRAPSIGAPVTFTLTPDDTNGKGVPVMYDTLRHDWYARRCRALCGDHEMLLEIGSGYGGMVWQLFRRGWQGTAVLCDIPETLYAAYYFLSAMGLNVRWHDESNTDADVILLPAQHFATWREPVTLVFAAHSLSEMSADVAHAYVRWITTTLRPLWVYYDAARLGSAFADPTQQNQTFARFPEQLVDAIRPGAPYREVFSAPITWAGSGNRYCEYLFLDMERIT